VAQLEQAYQQSRHRSKHVIPDGGSVTPNNNEGQSTLSPNVTSLVTALVENKVVSAESAGSTPSVVKGIPSLSSSDRPFNRQRSN